MSYFNRYKNIYYACRIVLFVIILLTPAINLSAQSASDSMIMNAMRDELYRNLNNLDANELEKPFFIAYTIANARQIQIIASLGALVRSNELSYKDWNVRLMVGDYEINDENFSSSQPEETMFRPSIEMPVVDDYLGIRRSLWLTTNNVYYSAGQTYKNKIAQIEHKQLDESDLEIADFSYAPTVKKYIYYQTPGYTKEMLEKKIKSISGIMKDFSEIVSSTVALSIFESTVYFINSEGTEVQFPFNITTLTVFAETLTDDSEKLNKNITYTVQLPGNLPSDDSVKTDIHKMIENLLALRNAERFDDNYYGPVLIAGEVAAETLEKFLFSGSDALIASRENLQSSSQMNMYYENNTNAFQARINKPIISKDITITAEPFLKSYRNIPLIGAFEIDAEGVIPQEQMILVENGILKTLLNGRTPSRQVPESNGHMRLTYSLNGLNKQVGPGVIRIETSHPVSYEDLKKQLLVHAREEGLDYAMAIKSLDVGGSDKPFNFYRIDVVTGEEKLIRSVRLKNLTMQSLRYDPLFTDSTLVHNTLLPQNGFGKNGLTGIPSSFIVPYAMLLNNVEMEGTRKPLTSMLPILENPVGKSTVSSLPENQ